MSALAFFFLGVYTLSLTYVTAYCLSQFNLLYYYKRFDWRRKKEEFKARFAAKAQAEAVAAAVVGGKTITSAQNLGVANADYSLMSTEEYEKTYPFVTIQLPLYNEKYVVERLIDNMVLMDYPRDRFEIHVLDDSTDETQELVKAKVAYHQMFAVRMRLRFFFY